MASAVIGALRVLLGIDSANFDKGVKDVRSKLGTLSGAFKSFAAGLGATLSFGAVIAGFKSIINHADTLGKTAQRIGVPVEELSKLKHAADLADVSFESLSTAFGRLSRNMLSVASGAKGDVALAFRTLGISVKEADGSLKSATQVLTEVAGKFATMPDGAHKTALAIQLFGRAGAQLIPLLNAGAAGMASMMHEAEQLGIVISKETAQAAEDFNDNLTRMRAAFQGLLIQALPKFLPALVAITNEMVRFSKETDIAETIGQTFSNWIISTIIDVKRLSAEFERFTMWLGIYKTNLTTLADGKDWERINDGLLKSTAITRKLNVEIQMLQNSINQRGIGGRKASKAVGSAGEDLEIISKEIDKQGDQFKRSLVNLKQYVDGLGQQSATLGMTSGALARAAASQDFYNRMQDQGIVLTARQTAQIEAQLNKIPAAISSLEVRQGIFDTLSGSISSFSDEIVSSVRGVDSLADAFKNLVNGMLKDLTRLFLNRALQQLLGAGFQFFSAGGGGPTNIIPFGGPRAAGGKVRRGSQYLVGEQGPELFSANKSGMIMPNGGGYTPVQIIDQRTTASPLPQQQQGSDGVQRFILRDAVRQQLPSELNRTMPSQFGLPSRLKTRG